MEQPKFTAKEIATVREALHASVSDQPGRVALITGIAMAEATTFGLSPGQLAGMILQRNPDKNSSVGELLIAAKTMLGQNSAYDTKLIELVLKTLQSAYLTAGTDDALERVTELGVMLVDLRRGTTASHETD